jgi:hypothetical protein
VSPSSQTKYEEPGATVPAAAKIVPAARRQRLCLAARVANQAKTVVIMGTG